MRFSRISDASIHFNGVNRARRSTDSKADLDQRILQLAEFTMELTVYSSENRIASTVKSDVVKP